MTTSPSRPICNCEQCRLFRDLMDMEKDDHLIHRDTHVVRAEDHWLVGTYKFNCVLAVIGEIFHPTPKEER